MDSDIKDLREIIENDEMFKEYVIIKLKEIDTRINSLESVFQCFKKIILAIIGIILAKFGIDVSAIIQ